MANNRCRVFTFMLYPDNYEQMRLLDWLKKGYLPCKSLYILHQPESDEKKPHFHVMVCFENERTEKGVRNYFGVIRTVWRLAHMSLNEDVTQKLKKDDNADTETGYIRVEHWRDKETFILKDPDDPLSYIEHEYHDGEKVCPAECKLDEVWRLCPVYVVPHVEKITDRCSYASYLLHETPQAIMDGKKCYSKEEIKGDEDFIQSCFPSPYRECTSNLIEDAITIGKGCQSQHEFTRKCLLLNRSDILEYTASHSHFVERFLLPHFDAKFCPNVRGCHNVKPNSP